MLFITVVITSMFGTLIVSQVIQFILTIHSTLSDIEIVVLWYSVLMSQWSSYVAAFSPVCKIHVDPTYGFTRAASEMTCYSLLSALLWQCTVQ